jgi:acyl-coenzyme A thioesterase PaaI-like protein
MASDLRDVPAEQFFDELRAMMGADGLITYRYLGRTVNTLDDSAGDHMRLRRDMRNRRGGLMAAPLAIACADTGGFTDIEHIPAPVVSSLYLIDDGVGVNEIEVRRTVLHRGRTLGFTRTEIVDRDNPERILAISTGTGVKLADAPEGFKPIDEPPEIPDDESLPPLHEVFGATRRADGTWQLPALDPKLRSTSGSLHHGPTHVVLEAAATDLAAAAGRVGADALQIEDWQVTFVARGTDGPFVTEGHAWEGNLGRIGCSLSLIDTGRDDRVVASAVATFRTQG